MSKKHKVEQFDDRRVSRPKTSLGGIIGFASLGATTVIAIIGGSVYIGGMASAVTTLTARMDKADTSEAEFTKEIRVTLDKISTNLQGVALQVAGISAVQPAPPPRRR